MTGFAIGAIILAIVATAALLTAGVGGISAVLLIVAVGGVIYLFQHTRRST